MAILYIIATAVWWRSGLGRSVEAQREERCASFAFDSRRGFASDMISTIGFVQLIEWCKIVGSAGVGYNQAICLFIHQVIQSVQ